MSPIHCRRGRANNRTVSFDDHFVASLLAVYDVVARPSIDQSFNPYSSKVERFCGGFPHQVAVTFHKKNIEGGNHNFLNQWLQTD